MCISIALAREGDPAIAEEETPLADAVVGGGFARAAYRLSLLALMGDGQSQVLGGPAAELAGIPLTHPLTLALPIHQAVGTSAVCGLPIALAGAIGFANGRLE